jgi:hypothetical protein
MHRGLPLLAPSGSTLCNAVFAFVQRNRIGANEHTVDFDEFGVTTLKLKNEAFELPEVKADDVKTAVHQPHTICNSSHDVD